MSKRPKNSVCKPVVYKTDPVRPDPTVIQEAARVIEAGGLVVFPTRALYGLGADADNPSAVARLFQAKGRATTNPVSILIRSRELLAALVEEVPPTAIPMMDRFWPGRLTLVFWAKAGVSSLLTAGTGKIGIRVPDHPVAAALVNALPGPITGTSANFSGSPGVSRIEDLPQDFLNQMDLVIDAGPLKGRVGSTVIDVTTHPPLVLREGAVSKKDLDL